MPRMSRLKHIASRELLTLAVKSLFSGGTNAHLFPGRAINLVMRNGPRGKLVSSPGIACFSSRGFNSENVPGRAVECDGSY